MESIRLRVLGRAAVERDGKLVRGRAVQSHHLALLALLAASPGGTASRDRLIGILWPESESGRARHRLSVALHAIRRGLGKDALHTSGDAVALNPDVVWTDVGQFLEAVESGHLEEAVNTCAGPFLDGFYLKDGADFGRWTEAERARLAGLCRSALERLAEEAEGRGDAVEAARWRRRLCTLAPYESGLALALIKTLRASDDAAGAIAHARAYLTRVEADLGIPPNPVIVELAEELAESARRRGGESPLVEPRWESVIAGTAATAPPSPAASDHPSMLGSDVTPPNRRAARQLAPLVVGGLVTVAAVWSFTGPGSATGDGGVPSVVVLPFTDLGAGPALGGAIADDITATLDIVPNLDVRYPNLPGPDGDDAWRGVARGLRAAHAVTGTSRTEGDRAEVTVQLRDVASGETLWEGTHARELRSSDALVEALSMAVADDLRTRLARYIPHHYTDSDEANNVFLNAVYEHKRFTEQRMWVALQHYRRAWETDPDFALAHAIAGSAYMGLSQNFGLPPEVGWENGREHVMQAIAIDPLLAEAYSVLGRLQFWWDRDYQAAEATLRRAMMLYPTHPDARTWYAYYQLYFLHDFDGAVANMRLQLELDPTTAPRSDDLTTVLFQSRRFEEAIEEQRRAWALDPELELSLSPYRVAHGYRELGRHDEAIVEYRAVHERRGGPTPMGLGMAYARAGRLEAARAILREREEQAEPAGPRGTSFAQLYASLGEHERALDMLEQEFDEDPTNLFYISTAVQFDPLRSEPRFQALLDRLGLVSVQRP